MTYSKVVWTLAVCVFVLFTAAGAAQVPADLKQFIGNWTLAMESPQGAMTLNLALKEENGKLQGAIHSDAVPEPQAITDITKADASLVLRYTRDLQGQKIPVKVTLTPVGDKTTVAFELGDLIALAGTGTRK